MKNSSLKNSSLCQTPVQLNKTLIGRSPTNNSIQAQTLGLIIAVKGAELHSHRLSTTTNNRKRKRAQFQLNTANNIELNRIPKADHRGLLKTKHRQTEGERWVGSPGRAPNGKRAMKIKR
ncbi:hypothetical protein P3X46_013054 [Hevea brasiliensis]|uniref:Uncharacterized protein n=1 Tax=Hevea brasiliensis TaxID=3981 RepID=A0ABQ9M2E4_HEVBR|nr:hypothetical protein P3X46_013054 [Hevea brasiliensis]